VHAVNGFWRWIVARHPLLLFGAALLIYVARRPQVLVTPEFRGEDGQVFYIGTYFIGPLESLFTPWNGSLHIVPRAVALLERLVPVSVAPLVANLAAVVIVAAIATYVATRLKVDLPIRLALATLILVLPGVNETHGQITWAPWHLAVFLVAVPLARRPASRIGQWIEAVAVLVAGLGAPLIVVLLPLYLHCRGRLLVAASVAAGAQLVTAFLLPRVTPAGGDLAFVAIRAIGEPFVGWHLITGGGLEWRLLLAGAVAVLLVMALRRAPRSWLALAAYIWAATLAAVIFRSGDSFAFLANGSSGNRYFLLPGLALTALVVAIAIRQRAPAAVTLCLVLVIGIILDFRIAAHPTLDWASRSACIGGPEPCVVPVYPTDVFSIRWPGVGGSYEP
jgi:hypothetical protein